MLFHMLRFEPYQMAEDPSQWPPYETVYRLQTVILEITGFQ